MEQRPLRLGDLVDDYCPRERRITNHAIVAIVENTIRQTRCTTCDAEHVYKEGKGPRRRKTAASDGDAASNAGGQLVVPVAASDAAPGPLAEEAPLPAPPVAAASEDPEPVVEPSDTRHEEGWAAHRPLIRATLPRSEGDVPPPRPIPEFTMHQRHTRGSNAFRHAGWNDRGRNGSRGHGRQGHGNANGNSFGNSHGRNQHGRHRGKKGQ